jgi:hypothetical protein
MTNENAAVTLEWDKEKFLPSVHSSIINPTKLDLRSISNGRYGTSVINRLSDGKDSLFIRNSVKILTRKPSVLKFHVDFIGSSR